MLVVGVVLVVLLVFVLLVPFSIHRATAASKYKAVLMTGAGCEDLQPGWKSSLDETASYLEKRGFTCYKFYSPDAKWSKIEPVIQGANIVVYAGHGYGYDPEDNYVDWSRNGFIINMGESYPEQNPYDPDYNYEMEAKRNGGIYQKIWQDNVALAPEALVIMMGACYTRGKTSMDSGEYTPLSVIKRRIEDYSKTFVDGNYNYIAGYGYLSYLKQILDNGKTLEQARDEGAREGTVKRYAHPQTAGETIKFTHYMYEDGSNNTSGVVAGNLSVTAKNILNDENYEPPPPDLPRQEPSPATPSNYNEYLLVSNPSPETANIRVEFTKPSGNSYSDFQVPAGGRYTLNINEFAYLEDVSLKVISDQAVVAERAMYFDSGQGRTGGHDTSGLTDLSNTWYFAGGYTAEAFDEYVLLQNPHGEAVTATLTLMREQHLTLTMEDGHTNIFEYTLEPNTRTTVHIDELAGFENAEVSVKVMASKPIAAERAMYFDYNGSLGGHVERGIEAPAKEWYLAEGYTVGFVEINDGVTSFDSYVLIQNPNDEPASVHVEFQKEHEQVVPYDVTVSPNSRYTIPVDGVAGMESTAFSTHVQSDKDIIVERSMYFNYRGQTGGHVAAGLTSLSKQFFFAEGYTAGEFDTYLLLQNPNYKAISVNVVYNVDPSYGSSVTRTYTIYPNSRFTVPVDEVLPAAAFGMTVTKDGELPFMAERAMYFNYGTSPAGNPITGGHDACGVPSPSTVWYFAEGYTGN